MEILFMILFLTVATYVTLASIALTFAIERIFQKPLRHLIYLAQLAFGISTLIVIAHGKVYIDRLYDKTAPEAFVKIEGLERNGQPVYYKIK